MLQTVLTAVAAITGILLVPAAALQIWRWNHQHRLRWMLVERKSLLKIAEELSPKISISIKDDSSKERTVNNVTRYRFVLYNNGLSPIDKNDIVEPLIWKAPGEILNTRVIVPSKNGAKLHLSTQKNMIEISWPLLNQRCGALVEVLCSVDRHDSSSQIYGQIRNIPEIEEKALNPSTNERIVSLVLSALCGTSAGMVMSSLDGTFFGYDVLSWLLMIVAMSTILFILLFFFYSTTNPYSKLIADADIKEGV